ncbi:5-dehydro-4-deoxyglucarate dehydratase [Polystyrenella longa]|uniref:5-dehydro-4-deoxyglucarate dehydratase n=1 Tax=Polystyrenella longa TaxID=2528007 RepID=A0A518CMX4_9PLAN|nr:dihydrodipicolinate synthase family protein [Polystyrenella longa]QDU80586.1 5-dehydro-4-deoxyglucarate dehydratase [Polystyrenella longa]
MKTEFSTDDLWSSVISVPPLARTHSGVLDLEENRKIIQYLEAGGVSTLLYGGNAILYHVALSEYDNLLTMLAELAAPDSLVIPSVGPGYGMMLDQATILKEHDFPTAMILPTRDVTTRQGVGLAVRRFVERFEKPVVLYIKTEGYIDVETVEKLVNDGLISCIKYAIVREQINDDPYLRDLADVVDPAMIISGIGEQPAIEHVRDFGLASFTSGCVCVAPYLSMKMLQSLRAKDYDTAEQIRKLFEPLEELRNAINPIRVLHRALELAEIADTGPIIPLLSELHRRDIPKVQQAATDLKAADEAARPALT